MRNWSLLLKNSCLKLVKVKRSKYIYNLIMRRWFRGKDAARYYQDTDCVQFHLLTVPPKHFGFGGFKT